MQERDFLNILINSKLLTRPWLRFMKNKFKSWRKVYEKLMKNKDSNYNLSNDKIGRIKKFLREEDIVVLVDQYKDQGIFYISIDDKEYPACLKMIHDAPLLLYYKGNIRALKEGVAIVGTRNPTQYGLKVVKDLTRVLSEFDINIISGLARGIDGIAHESALENESLTCAVLAHGLDIIYPVSNQRLADNILKSGGILISEYPLGTIPERYNFPQRNRIIAGLSKFIIIPEADKKSGSLITAGFALDNGKDVVAVPGSIFSKYSTGTNQLINDGAFPLRSIESITDFINNGKQISIEFEKNDLSKIETDILEILSTYPTEIGLLIYRTGLSISKVIEILSSLEIKGYVENIGGEKFIRIG